MVARAIQPAYALGPHTGSLGLTFADGARLGPSFASGAFVGQHGSWNRNPPSGYKAIFVPFAGGQPSGRPAEARKRVGWGTWGAERGEVGGLRCIKTK